MITIEYCKNGEAVSDFDVDSFIHRIKEMLKYSGNEYFDVSTSIPIHAIRLEIVKGRIDPEQIQFKYNGENFKANKYGVIEDWPKGFCDIDLKLSDEILGTVMDIRLKERSKHEIKKS